MPVVVFGGEPKTSDAPPTDRGIPALLISCTPYDLYQSETMFHEHPLTLA